MSVLPLECMMLFRFPEYNESMAIIVQVQSYSGYKSDERPVRFTLGRRQVEVEEIEDQWYSPDAIYFRIRTKKHDSYILRHDEIQDVWTVEVFRSLGVTG